MERIRIVVVALLIAEACASEVAAFIGSDEWVDMEKVFKAGWITGRERR